MRAYVLTHLSDDALVCDLTALVARDRDTTAALLAHIGEVDARKLYLPAGYPSMHAYCVGELRFSEDAAYKRIQVARAGRTFPAIFAAIAEGRLHLTAARCLAPYLTAQNADELLAASEHRNTMQIEQLIARRFARTRSADAAAGRVTAILPPPESESTLGPAVDGAAKTDQQVSRPVGPTVGSVGAGPERFHLEISIDGATRDKLQYVQSLLGHAVPSGDLSKVIDRALDALIAKLEKQKFAATDRPREPRAPQEPRATSRTVARTRHIPSHVKRVVWERDGGKCTFTSAEGRRCEARMRLEFDHVEPFARGGEGSVEGLRLRCRPHNQLGAERAFGLGFINEKRAEARQARAKESRAAIETRRNAALASDIHDGTRAVYSGLRNLGCRAEEARRASEHAAAIGPLPIEWRLRKAIQFLGKKPGQVTGQVAGQEARNRS